MIEDDPAAESIPVWNSHPGGDYGVRAAETRTTDPGVDWRRTTIIRNVFDPSITVFRPTVGTRTGASVVVLPGGGFGGLAWDAEGTEVGQFLAERGITAFVLKYRVQRPRLRGMLPFLVGRMKAGVEPAIAAAAADATQAMRLVRARAREFEIDPGAVGMIGFSAGAITMLRVLADADPATRPDFAVCVYGFLWDGDVRPDDVPLLVAAAEPDTAVADARRIDALWTAAGVPHDLHIFASGDHGFGLGRPGTDSARFTSVLEEWLVARGYARRPR
ncbi:alpha/beta hydrolase [Microbacterium hominis]|uniref:Dienelactone hydrolase family protein n=1 Tax=Microbacterium hominis TaxID=162426 RepID=A0A7D4TQ66_9MICO|nr:dienelactone hydrolase family protein [Microbacterium hominis]QKJ18924.1 dienelactone hydrolase family protein [Microbacterium hominis]